MRSKEPSLSLRDILDSIGMIEEFTRGMSFEAFRQDAKTIAAVERKLLVIGEAAARLGREAPFVVPEVPWRNIRGMGNWLRHQYDHVDLETVWNTVQNHLPLLAEAIQRALSASDCPPS